MKFKINLTPKDWNDNQKLILFNTVTPQIILLMGLISLYMYGYYKGIYNEIGTLWSIPLIALGVWATLFILCSLRIAINKKMINYDWLGDRNYEANDTVLLITWGEKNTLTLPWKDITSFSVTEKTIFIYVKKNVQFIQKEQMHDGGDELIELLKTNHVPFKKWRIDSEKKIIPTMFLYSLIPIAVFVAVTFATVTRGGSDSLPRFSEGEISYRDGQLAYTLPNPSGQSADEMHAYATNGVLALNTLMQSGQKEILQGVGAPLTDEISTIVLLMNEEGSDVPIYIGLYYWSDLDKVDYDKWYKKVDDGPMWMASYSASLSRGKGELNETTLANKSHGKFILLSGKRDHDIKIEENIFNLVVEGNTLKSSLEIIDKIK